MASCRTHWQNYTIEEPLKNFEVHSCNRCPHFRKNKMAASKAQSRVQSEAESMLTSLEKDKVRPMQVRLNTEKISFLQPPCSIVVMKF